MEAPAVPDSPFSVLPLDLQNQIIAHFPFPHFFTIPLLSKRCKNLFSDPFFLRLCDHTPVPPSSWLLLPKYPSYLGCLAFNSLNNHWFNLPLSSLPLNLHVDSVKDGVLVLTSPDYTPVPKIYLYNPLRRAKLEITCPGFIRGSSSVVCLSHNKYKVLVLALKSGVEDAVAVLAYHSDMNVWKEESRLSSDFVLDSPLKKTVHLGHKWFVLGEKRDSERRIALMYDTHIQDWTPILLPNDRLETKSWIMNCKNALFLAQLQNTEIHMWMLDMQSLNWMDWGSVPQEFATEFVEGKRKRSDLDDCSAMDQYLVFCKLPKILAFDTVQKSWKWLPNNPILHESLMFSKCAFSFDPLLCTMV